MCSTQLGAAEPDGAGGLRKLTLSECLQLALKHNLDLQITRLDPTIAEYNLSGAYGAWDPTFSVGVGRNFVDSPLAVDPKKSGLDVQYDLRDDTASAGIKGKAPTGLSYELGGAITEERARADFNVLPTLPSGIPLDGIRQTKQYFFTTGLTLRQPLLKNLWIDSDRLQIQVSRRNLKISELALLGKIMGTVSTVQQAYYDLAFAQEDLKIRQANLASGEQLLNDARTRIKVGGLPPANDRLYEFFVQTAREDLAQAERTVGDLEAALRNLISEDIKDWKSTVVDTTDIFNAPEEHFDVISSWRDAMTKRPEIRQLELDLEKQDIVLRYDRNQLYPSLDLVGSYGLNAIDNTLARTTTQIERGNHQSYSYGVVMSIPFSNRSNRSRYKVNQEVKKQALLRYKQVEMSLMTDVENNGRQMRTAFQRVQLAKRAAELAEEVFKAEQSRMLLDPTGSFILLESRRRWTSAQSEAIRAVVDYNKARTQLSLSRGDILDRNSINISIK